MKSIRGFSIALAVLALAGGCEPVTRTGVQPLPSLQQRANTGPRLSLFLALRDSEVPGVRFQVERIEVFAAGEWLPITASPLQMDSGAIGSKQIFLCGRSVPSGRYEQLRIHVAEGSVRGDDGIYVLAPFDTSVIDLPLPSPLLLREDDSLSLFVTWDVWASLPRPGQLQPALTVASQLKPLLVDLIYAACPDIDTIFVIRTDKNWVTSSFGVKGHPTHLALDPDPTRQRLYVLASQEAAVKVLDLSSQRVVDSFRLPLTRTPSFLTISPDGRSAYVLEERDSYLTQVDLTTGQNVARVRLNYRPQYSTYLADQNLLAVTAGLSQTVLLLDPRNLSVRRRISVGSSPEGLLVSEGNLLIAEGGNDMVSVYDLATNLLSSRVAVGAGPRRLLSAGNRIYVSNYHDGSLSVLVPNPLGVIREIPVSGRPLEMAFDPTYRQVYVADDEGLGLAVVDAVGMQLKGRVQLGAKPLGLAALQ